MIVSVRRPDVNCITCGARSQKHLPGCPERERSEWRLEREKYHSKVERARKAREGRAKLKAELKGAERTLLCPKGEACKITLYVPGDAWCPHGRMK